MSGMRSFCLTKPIGRYFPNRSTRAFTSARAQQANLPFKSGPAPPRLPEEDQKIFEELQRQSTGAFSTPRSQRLDAPSPTEINQSPDASTSEAAEARNEIAQRLAKLRGQNTQIEGSSATLSKKVRIDDEGDTLHPDLRRGAQPEFEGDRNPKTGEIGGPKNEPLRWGAAGEWTYNGRATDF
ncbi:hypothetical protein UCRPC4_g02920 [Phaeomoniella chlamydospora]|uniref:Succinate dehydrogenase assembly factor 4, mitochondrial n=1 Tax=Phaeomoniella chlamydospora TaxID=158046 RepID=A0A0G2EL15_PHACM|nr:hypothetical protein UCRPC4_g02920 [Phaeomoniella chlamydospora]